MRFMVQVRATPGTEAGVMPEPEMFAAMGAFNDKLIAGGHMLAGDGLRDSSYGARIVWKDGKQSVIDGPFAETKELIAGFWIVDFPSKAAVVEFFKQCPPPTEGGEGTLEIRRVFDPSDFEGFAPPEMLEKEEAFMKEHGLAGRA
jgi:hypothetical protein